MAWLQQDPSGNFHISFRFGGLKFKRSLQTKKQNVAQARLTLLQENIRLVESGRIEVPPDADIPVFLLTNGKLAGKPVVPKSLKLSELFDEFFTSLPDI